MKNNFKPYIIAEIGINHNGNLKKALKLVNSAKKAGANAAKFQVFNPITLARESSKKSYQQKKTLSKNISLFKMWNKVSLSFEKLNRLKRECKKVKIDFICSVFDKESLKKVLKLNPKFIKVASSDITDLLLLGLIKKSKKKIILSTGLSNEFEIKRALKILGKSTIVLHCVSSYPCANELSNLNRIKSLKKKLKVKVGYSDHTIGNQACFIALMLGAEVIEKHFTLNKNLKGGDHLLSANEKDLREIVVFSKNLKKMLGNGSLPPSKLELRNKKLFRKGVYYSRMIEANKKISLNDLIFARPETKLSILNYKKILGKKTRVKKKKFDEVKIEDIKL